MQHRVREALPRNIPSEHEPPFRSALLPSLSRQLMRQIQVLCLLLIHAFAGMAVPAERMKSFDLDPCRVW